MPAGDGIRRVGKGADTTLVSPSNEGSAVPTRSFFASVDGGHGAQSSLRR